MISTPTVEQFIANLPISLDNDMPRLYGNPLHMDPHELLANYKNMSLDDYITYESRHSIGNYLIIDSNNTETTIITSPGYCGGYFYSKNGIGIAATVLRNVLSTIGQSIAMDAFPLSYFFTYNPKGSYQQLPFRTPFEGVLRLPPAAILKFDGPDCKVYRSYIASIRKSKAPATFERALAEISHAVSRHVKGGADPVLMFSGGVDCLALYLGMREASVPVRPVVVEHNQANGPDRAFAVADKLGFELEMVDSSYETSFILADMISVRMVDDIVAGRGPAVALMGRDFGGGLMVSGQNVDAFAHVNMTVLQTHFERPLMSNISSGEAATRIKDYDTFFHNLMFTRPYLTDGKFQAYTARSYSKMNNSVVVDPRVGPDGVLRGMISTQLPNLLPRTSDIQKMMRNIQHEVDMFKNFVGDSSSDLEFSIQVIRYYTYAALSSKRLSTFANPDGSRIELLAQSGPMLSYFIGKHRRLSDAASPKAEIYAYVEAKTGRPYSELAKPTRKPFGQRKMDKYMADPIIGQWLHLIDPTRSTVIPRIADDTTKREFIELYRGLFDGIRAGDQSTSMFNISQARHAINLERLIYKALGIEPEDAAVAGLVVRPILPPARP